MDSDSDDDFLSADEGDDEILEKIPEVIQIAAKTETLSIKDTPKSVSNFDEDTCSKNDIDSNNKEEVSPSALPSRKDVPTEKDINEAPESEVSFEKEVPTEISPKEELNETMRKPRRVKRLGDKSKEPDSTKNEEIDVASIDEIVKVEIVEEKDPKVEIEASNSEEQDVKNEDEQIEENSIKTDDVMVKDLEDPKHEDEPNKEKDVEKSDEIEDQLKETEENDNLKEDVHEEDAIQDKDEPIVDNSNKLTDGHEDAIEKDIDEIESAHSDKSEEGIVLKNTEISTESEIQESDILAVDGSDENEEDNEKESKETAQEQTIVSEMVCPEDDTENLETDDLSKRLPIDKDDSKPHVNEIVEDTVESEVLDKEPTKEDTSVEEQSKGEPKEDRPTNNEVVEKAHSEKAPAEKVPTEKAPTEKVPLEKPEKVQKPRKIKRLGVKTEKLGTKTSSKSAIENTEQTTENLKKAEEVDDGWNNDDFTDDFSSEKKKVEESSSATPGKDGDWGWDSWADNIISQATNKVSDLMETVEGQLGIPDPNRLAKNIKAAEMEREKEIKESLSKDDKECNTSNIQEQPKENLSSWFSSFVPVNSISNLVQTRGQDLVTGGIDALEYLGKSTVNYLSEGDPGLRNKRKALFERRKGPSLASVLQEAKLKTEEKELSGTLPAGEDPKKLNDMLEKFQALAHMDAIQMLSNENAAKVKRILNVQSEEAKLESMGLLESINEAYEVIEDDKADLENLDFKKDLFASTKLLKLKVTCSKLLNTWSKLNEKADAMDYNDCEKTFESCIASLAELVARCIEYYRKVADMMLLTDFQAKDQCLVRAKSLKAVTEMFQHEVSGLSNKYANYLANNDEDKKTSDLITDIYMESENCCSLLQDSHELLLPILHSSAIK